MEESVDEDAVWNGTEDGTNAMKPRPWWSESLAEDNYVHEIVAWHLVKSGKRDGLRGLLGDARWIKLRLVIGGIVSLQNDFAELVRTENSAVVGGHESAAESCE